MTSAPTCSSCGAPLRNTFVNLGETPISNSNVRQQDYSRKDPVYPLHVRVCAHCLLVQADSVVPREEHFNEDYQYFSSFAASWVEHARKYCVEMIDRFGLTGTSTVCEIASNDGYLLQHFKERGMSVLGVEPTNSTANAAIGKGIPTDIAFFGRDTAERLKAAGFAADLMAANNVLAHVPDINDFVSGFAILLKPQGVWTVEFPHILHLIDQCQFDTIYHEHYSYLSLLVVEALLARHGMRVFDVQELPTHGGSLRVFAALNGASYTELEGLRRVRAKETAYGLGSLDAYKNFEPKVLEVKRQLLSFLERARAEGKTVVAYGAAAKGNTLLNYCGIDAGHIRFVADLNVHKQGRYLPGSRLAIVSPDKIAETRPDYILILPWNLKHEIVQQLSFARDWDARFVTAIPQLEVF
jgi:2-polyprenyl-3-methyl-5-hydroxy-6-metoxy-1,4-benzoquinol methylase